MSSKPEAQNEPTMEEILASIRRIISEDEPQDAKPAEAAPSAPPAPPVVKAKPAAAAAPAAVAAPPQPPAASVRGADNILDLTRMVAEDGSIVDLEAVEAPEEAAEAEAAAEVEVAAEMPEPPVEEAPDMAAEVEPEPETAEAPEVPEVEDAALAEPVAEEPAAEEAAQDSTEDTAADAPEEAAPAEEAPEEAAPEEETPAAASLVPAPVGEESEFVSAATAAEATASLAAVTKAAMANRQSDAVAIGGGRSLEDLVRQSLAPELKGWLDDNLPDLVERIVREEIRKMIRRAEDQ